MRCQLLSIISITDLQPRHGGLQNYPGSLPHWGKFAGSRSKPPNSVKKGIFSVQTYSGQHWWVLKRLLVPF